MEFGYIMIDCGGLNLMSEASQTITGLYAQLAEARATDKMIVACNMVWGDSGKVPPTPVILTAPNASTYVCAAGTLQINVTSADVVTIEGGN